MPSLDEDQKHELLERFWESFSLLVQGTLAFAPMEDWDELKMRMQEKTSVYGTSDTDVDRAIHQALLAHFFKTPKKS